ncbi:MAG: tyrosine-protein phosphatase [Caulobacteraceae bacterium]
MNRAPKEEASFAPTFEGISNFRDFGGAATARGPIRSGVLFRSGDHSSATDLDLARLSELKVTTIIDLRRPDERRRVPCRRCEGVQLIENDEEAEDDWRAHIARGDLSEAGFSAYLVAYYAKAPFQPRLIDLYSRYFQALGEREGAILIHCAAGKDRTGILAALTLHLLGAHEDDVLADYLLSNDPARFALHLPRVARTVEEISGGKVEEAAIIAAMGVRAEYLAAALSAIQEDGGLETYLAERMGIDARLRTAIEDRLLGV